MPHQKETTGYIHVYTGDGKGKTTAALGLALRAVGAGKRVFLAQFVKGMVYSEIEAIVKYLPDITVKQYGRNCFIMKNPTADDIEAAQSGLKEVAEIIISGTYDMIILDEISIAIHYHLLELQDVIKLLKRKNKSAEIIVTGRYAPPALLETADLVTEMKEIRHYYKKGIQARKGIEF